MIGVVCERTSGNASVAAIDEYDLVPRKSAFVNDNSGTNIEDAKMQPAPSIHPPVDIDTFFDQLADEYDDVFRQLAD